MSDMPARSAPGLYQHLQKSMREQVRKSFSESEASRRNFLAEYPIVAFDKAAPGTERTIVWAHEQDPTNWAIEEPAPPVPTEPSHEHIWNMLVLAAESSRYGDKS